MDQVGFLRGLRRGIGLGLALVALGSVAAPVGGSDEADRPVNAGGSLPVPARQAAPGAATAVQKATPPDVSTGTGTGNKNLDLLLELHGKPEEEARAPLRGSAAAASAAAAELAALRARAAQRPDEAASASAAGVSKQARSIFDGAPTTDAEGRPLAQGADRRAWGGRPAGTGAGAAGTGGGLVESGGLVVDSRYGQEGIGEDNVLRRLPMAVIEFLRDNRYWILGALVAVAALVIGNQAQGRRR